MLIKKDTLQTRKRVERAIIEISTLHTNEMQIDVDIYVPTTREIANRCDMSIYTARRILLDLADAGIVKSLKMTDKKNLRWRINF